MARHQQRFINETPWSLQTSFIPWLWCSRAQTLTITSYPAGRNQFAVDVGQVPPLTDAASTEWQ